MPTSAGYINESLGLMSISKEVTAGLPNWEFTCTGGTNTEVTVSASSGNTHDNNLATSVNDFFIGAQLYWKAGGALAAEVRDITDYTLVGTTATFTVSPAWSASAATAATDEFYVLYPLPASNVSINVSVENHERDFVRQSLDKASSLKGLKVCDGSFDVEIPGMTTSSAHATAPAVDRYSSILSVVGNRRATVGAEVVAGTLSTTQASVANASTFAVDDLVMINNQVRRLTVVDTSGNILTFSPPLSAAPTVALPDVVYTGEQWEAIDDGHQTLTLLYLKDDRLIECRGAVCSVKLTAEFGGVMGASVDFNAAYMASGGVEEGWFLYSGVTMGGEQTSKKPPVFMTSAAAHFGTTLLNIASFDFDLGHGRVEHRYVDSHYFTINERAATCGVNFKDTSVTPKSTWEATGTTDELIMTCGSSVTDTVAISGQTQIQDAAAFAENNGFQDYNAAFAFVDDQTDLSNAKGPRIVRF